MCLAHGACLHTMPYMGKINKFEKEAKLKTNQIVSLGAFTWQHIFG